MTNHNTVNSNSDDSLLFHEIEAAGPAVRPLEFPTPRVHRASCISARARDHTTGRSTVCTSLLVRVGAAARAYEGSHHHSNERAYLMKKKLSKSTYGSIRLCVVLRRRQLGDGSGDDNDNVDIDIDTEEDADVEWESTDELVALKASSWNKIRKFRGRHLEDPIKEVAALQYSGNYHPNVLGCIEILQDDDYLYTVMPYCTGGDLFSNIMAGQILNRLDQPVKTALRRPNEEQARLWFRQLLQGLGHLQRKGICHRDLSLENLLLDEYGDLVIVDLGLALRVPYADASNPGCISGVSEGTHRLLMKAQGQSGDFLYLAPEIVEGHDAFDGFAVDLWSAGVILFVSLVGMAPFRWAHSSDIRYSQIAKGNLRELMKDLAIPLSPDAIDLLQSMLRRDPRKRLSLAQIMNHPWVSTPQRETLGPPPLAPKDKTQHAMNAKLRSTVDPCSLQRTLIDMGPAACKPSRVALERFASF